MHITNINPKAAHQRHITCLHCGGTGHKPGLDCVRYICGDCVAAAMHPHGKSLRFPHDEQDEFLLTGHSSHSSHSSQGGSL